MRGLLRIFVILVIINEGLACGRGRKKKKGKGKPGQQEQPSDVVDSILGPVKTSPYSSSGDNPTSCDGLGCNFEESCCWSNAQPQADQLEWLTGSGQPDAEKMQKHFSTQNVPDGSYLITASEEAGDDSQSAQFYSCPIECAGSDITVKLKHWTTKTMKLEVCTEASPEGPPENCQPVPGDNGNEDSVTVPKGENTRVVIKASGFTAAEGSLAMISNVEVMCDPCLTTTQAQPTEGPVPVTTSGAATPGPSTGAPSTVCKDLTCNFEGGNLCNYQSEGTAHKNFANEQNPFHNRLTGVPKNGEGQKFAGCYMKAKQGEKSSLVSKTAFEDAYTITYKYHMDTDGVSLKGCCDDESKCTPAADPAVQVKDYQAWKEASFSCPAGTKQVMFVADNEKGANEGAAAVDDIKASKGGQAGGAAC